MLASHQQNAKLDAIKHVVERLENHEIDKIVAMLDSAEGVLHDSMTASLDKLDVPEAVGLGSTAGSVKETKALTLNWLTKWEAVADRFGTNQRVDIDDLKEHLAKTAIGGFEAFGALVQLTLPGAGARLQGAHCRHGRSDDSTSRRVGRALPGEHRTPAG